MKFKDKNVNFSIDGSYTFLETEFQKNHILGMLLENAIRPEIVCLTGSTRFRTMYAQCNQEFTLDGKIVLTVGWLTHKGGSEVSEEEKIKLDELHLRKIDLADFIFVINVGRYIGESTANEITYAKSIGKRIEYLEE